MGEIRNITWDKESIKKLRLCYDKAVEQNKEIFDCSGVEFYTPYAKFLLEFYESKLLNKN